MKQCKIIWFNGKVKCNENNREKITLSKCIFPQIYLYILPSLFPKSFLVVVTQFLSFLLIFNCQQNAPNKYPYVFFIFCTKCIFPSDFLCQFILPNLSSHFYGKDSILCFKYGYPTITSQPPPTLLFLEKIYNKSHVVQLLCTPTLSQQHYPPHKYK